MREKVKEKGTVFGIVDYPLQPSGDAPNVVAVCTTIESAKALIRDLEDLAEEDSVEKAYIIRLLPLY